jgi:SnoaL-like domain
MDAPPNTESVQTWYALYSLEATYWHDVDFNGGRNAATFYVPAGVFAVGDNQFEGHSRISAFYAWRRRRGEASTRHIVHNLLVERIDERRAKAIAVMAIYRGTGRPPFTGRNAPILVGDLASDCILDADDRWRYVSHRLDPIFVGNDVPLSLAVDVRELAARERALIETNGGS